MNTTTTATNAAVDFIFFEGAAASGSRSRPRITIRRGGMITMTRAAVARLGRTSPVCSWPSTARPVQSAFRQPPRVRRAATGSATKKGAGRQITGKRFFLHFGLDLTAPARSFDATDFGGGLIGFTFEVKPAAAPVEEVPASASAKSPPPTVRPARTAKPPDRGQ